MEKDFWDMTLGECKRYQEAYIWKYNNDLKNKAQFDHTLAFLFKCAVAGAINGKSDMPTIEDAYPSIFTKSEEEVRAKKNKDSTIRFLNFARSFNAKFKKGEQTND